MADLPFLLYNVFMITYKPIIQKDKDIIREFLYIAVHFPDDKIKPLIDELMVIPEISRYYRYVPEFGEGFITYEDNNAIGAAWYIEFPDDDPGYGYVKDGVPELSISIIDKHRGQGLGTEMIEKLINMAKEKGYFEISLSVDEVNPAIKLYERLGFEKIRLDGQSWVMAKGL